MLNFTALQCSLATLHFTTLHFTSLHYTTLRYTTLPCIPQPSLADAGAPYTAVVLAVSAICKQEPTPHICKQETPRQEAEKLLSIEM